MHCGMSRPILACCKRKYEQAKFWFLQADKLAESQRMLKEEEEARLATSALHKRDLVLKLRKVPSTALGSHSSALGSQSTALGSQSSALGSQSTALGSHSAAVLCC